MRDTRIGTVTTLPGTAYAELVAEAFDLVWIDLEHAALSAADAVEMIIGTQAAQALAFVRVPVEAYHLMAVVLDAGADGVVLADVHHAAQAEAAVARMQHPPRGIRGWGPRRLSTRHRGTPTAVPEIWAQIESREGVSNASAIARVVGIDRLVVGCADLSWDLGAPMEFDAAELTTAVQSVADSAAQADVQFGIAGPLDVVPADLLHNATVFVHSTDARITAAAVDAARATIQCRIPSATIQEDS